MSEMIRANELRIGNVVTIDNEKHHGKMKEIPMVVTSIGRSHIKDNGEYKYVNYCDLDRLIPIKRDWENFSQYIHFLKPIAITEEWLLKMGFEFNNYPDSLSLNVLSHGVLNAYNISEKVRIEIKSGYIFGDSKIKYVHQLQNLYFALTRKELEMSNGNS